MGTNFIEEEDLVLNRYDEIIYEILSDEQKEMVGEVKAESGFDHHCAPSYCPKYGVALLSNIAVSIESSAALLSFLGSIDTKAELSLWLSTKDYSGESYQATDDGYNVVAELRADCADRVRYHIHVTVDGELTRLKELSWYGVNVCP